MLADVASGHGGVWQMWQLCVRFSIHTLPHLPPGRGGGLAATSARYAHNVDYVKYIMQCYQWLGFIGAENDAADTTCSARIL